jgi:hypothetical protein
MVMAGAKDKDLARMRASSDTMIWEWFSLVRDQRAIMHRQ